MNEDSQYEELAREVNDSYTLVMEAEPSKGVPNSMVLGFQISEGKMTDIWRGDRRTDFVLSAKYGDFVDILTGTLNVTKAFVTRKLKIKGSLARMLKTSKATERFVEVLKTIPTEFEGDYGK
ncbi:MAG: SCP2 sterol-binding domain-containing protein [Theionarchaea archaeon]|nr:SCP2 sterol-binding domain-containing protein [Theionarchaea archaeon]MBU7001147.1 SCP2 sterol-binding domain-containing protein [Theionarchaea archaeon]MBU7019926.1 SCP2 sterol-binding domain-containing protein [Theionarchaea archaeon]MBU7034018.1 SCP2 sterol-binding domain-containing protein [Theionarchaea archaeon]MBU7039553.1 SCP2 sterol-binding domain-containing protein [Theionarchaea archaeon]